MINVPALLAKDAYKVGHVDQYPKKTEMVYSNLTPRSAARAPRSSVFDGKVVVWGIRAFALDFLFESFKKTFFSRDKEEVLEEYIQTVRSVLGIEAVYTDHIAQLHDLGYLPIHLQALPEGSVIKCKIPMVLINNTHPDFGWLTNFIETELSSEVWKPTTVASIARQYRMLCLRYARITGVNIGKDRYAFTDFTAIQCHDFSARGMSGINDAANSGTGHLLSSIGTDTLAAVWNMNRLYYTGNSIVGVSVPATEHSVMCAGGKENEKETYRRLIQDVYPSGIVSIVSDTWNLWNVIGYGGIAEQLKDIILERDGKVVFRPDSGDPVKIITGYLLAPPGLTIIQAYTAGYEAIHFEDDIYAIDPNFTLGQKLSHAEVVGAVECLDDIFGSTSNDMGYKTLNPKVGLIYGDSITLERAERIFTRLINKGYASDNIVFGIGSYTYQMITRDTYGMAVKATLVVINDQHVEIFKDPVTDDGTKKSARGLINVRKGADGEFFMEDQQSSLVPLDTAFETVFRNGVVFCEDELVDIRKRVSDSFNV